MVSRMFSGSDPCSSCAADSQELKRTFTQASARLMGRSQTEPLIGPKSAFDALWGTGGTAGGSAEKV